MQEKILVIYHGNCADGFTAAWVTGAFYGRSNIEFFAGVYQTPPPDVTGRTVVIVDFSYKRDAMLQILEKAKEVIWLDHHISAIRDLEGVEGFKDKVLDINRSGAMIAWDYFFPGVPAPAAIRVIQDRDLWKFELPNTQVIQANYFSYEYTWENWDVIMESDPSSFIAGGEAILRKHNKDINELLQVVTREMVIAGHRVKVANLPYVYVSEAGHILCQDAPFAACYWDTPQGRVFGLRSSENGLDVSEIAKVYGGGGHQHAAGFKVSFSVAESFEVQDA